MDHFWFCGKRVDRGCSMFKAEYSHQMVVNGVHAAEGSLIFFHHSSSGLPSEIFFYFPFHTDPGSFMHAADFYFAVFLHLLIYFFLIIGDNIKFFLQKRIRRQKVLHGPGAVLVGCQVKGSAGFQIFCNFIHDKCSFQNTVVFFAFHRYNYNLQDK